MSAAMILGSLRLHSDGQNRFLRIPASSAAPRCVPTFSFVIFSPPYFDFWNRVKPLFSGAGFRGAEVRADSPMDGPLHRQQKTRKPFPSTFCLAFPSQRSLHSLTPFSRHHSEIKKKKKRKTPNALTRCPGTSSQEGLPEWPPAGPPAPFPAGQGYWQSHLARPHQWPEPGPPSCPHWLPPEEKTYR